MDLTGAVHLAERTAGSRVLFGPHETNLGRGRSISDRHVAYYARRAAGGAGVVVTETASVHDSDWPYEYAPLAASCAPGWAAVTAACRPYGALVLASLGHAGGQGSSAYHRRVLWGPSRVPDVVSREVPMEVEQPEIDALVSGFAAAAALAVDAGTDGVEVEAGQHALLRQFLSGLTNRRTDRYGPDRALLLGEVLAAVRAAIGPAHVLGLRLGCDELAPWAGITPSSAAETVARVAPLVDYLVPVRGSALSVSATRPDLHTPPGFNTGLCADLRARVGTYRHASRDSPTRESGLPDTRVGSCEPASPRVPVRESGSSVAGIRGRVPAFVLQGSVVDPAAAQAALDDGVADLVEMTRAQIAEPDLVAHVRAGTPGRIRPCTLSNQRAAARDPRNPVVGDEAEPSAGYETVDPPVVGHDRRVRDVLVVGGGPAGLEAARVLALRGHRVRLVERGPRLGGALLLAAAVSGRERMGLLVPWWEGELRRLGVRVETGVEVDDLLAEEAVLLATGSRPRPHRFDADVPVLPVAEFLAGFGAIGAGAIGAGAIDGPVLVHDPVGDWTGVGIAELLAASGRETVLVTPDAVAGHQLGVTGDLAPANARLDRAGVVKELRARLVGVASGCAELENAWTGARHRIQCAAVVDCSARLPDDALWRACTEVEVPTRVSASPDSRVGSGGLARTKWGTPVVRAGDCVAPRTVAEAVREGRRGALLLGGFS